MDPASPKFYASQATLERKFLLTKKVSLDRSHNIGVRSGNKFTKFVKKRRRNASQIVNISAPGARHAYIRVWKFKDGAAGIVKN